MPLYIYTGVNTVFSLIYLGAQMSTAPKGSYSIPRASMFQSLVYAIVNTLLAIPFGIIANRYVLRPSFLFSSLLGLFLPPYHSISPRHWSWRLD